MSYTQETETQPSKNKEIYFSQTTAQHQHQQQHQPFFLARYAYLLYLNKFLGVVFNSTKCFQQHIDSIVSVVNQRFSTCFVG